MAKHPQIALLIESSRAYGRGLLRGIAQYAQSHGPWGFYHQERALGEAAPRWLRNFDGDGMIVRVDSRKLLEQIKQMDLPTVDLRCMYQIEGIPNIAVDNLAVARLAADHLLERKFEHYACCGFAGVDYSRQRCDHFVRYLAEAGYDASVWIGPGQSPSVSTTTIEAMALTREAGLRAWLESLPKPVGIMATNDVRAQQVLNACGFCGIAVPEEAAVIGVDNDDVVCELCNPPLSSIQLNTVKIGYEAAALLDRMLQGESPPEQTMSIPPLGIVTRQSTDVVAIPDPAAVAAVHYIREHACDGIGVEDVLDHVACSRSTLERRFARYLGRTTPSRDRPRPTATGQAFARRHGPPVDDHRRHCRIQPCRVHVPPVQEQDRPDRGTISPSGPKEGCPVSKGPDAPRGRFFFAAGSAAFFGCIVLEYW